MKNIPIDRSAARTRKIAWSCVAGAAILAAIRAAQGFFPDHLLDSRYFLDSIGPGLFLAAGLFAWIFVGSKILLAAAARPWRYRTEVSKRLELPALEAEELTIRALAQLLDLRFRPGPREPLPGGGWRTVASRRSRPGLNDDPRRAAQSVEFEYVPGSLILTHRFKCRHDFFERGEREYQEWILGSLVEEKSLESPPPRLSLAAFAAFQIGVFAAAMGALLHFAPEARRGDWAIWFALPLAMGLVFPLLYLPGFLAEGRRTRAKGLVLAGLILTLFGGFFWAARQNVWQVERWEKTDDPVVLCRAGRSVWREEACNHFVRMRTERREEAALQAMLAIERRMVAMGSRVVSPLVSSHYAPGESVSSWRVLERIGRPAVPALIGALSHPESEVRNRAIWVLRDFPLSEEVDRAVMRALQDRDSLIRRSAAAYFEYRNLAAPEPWSEEIDRGLVALLDDPEGDVRGAAIDTLGSRRARQAVPRLLAKLGEDRAQRSKILFALRAIGDPQAFPAVLEAWRADPEGGGLYLFTSFGACGVGALLDLLDTPHAAKAREILQGSGSGPVDLPQSTLQRLLVLADHAEASQRRCALGVLARANNPEAHRRALRFLDSDDESAVSIVLRHFGASGEIPVEKLISIVRDTRRDEWLRGRALSCFEREATDALPTSLALDLLNDPKPSLRERAADVLGHRKEGRAATALIRALGNDPSVSVRNAAIRALGEMGSKEAVLPICEDLSNNYAVEALGKIGDPRARPALRAVMAQDPRPESAQMFLPAAAALAMTGDRDVIPLLRRAIRTSGWAEKAARAFSRLGEEGVDHLLEILDEGYARSSAAEALGGTGSARALPRLRELLNDSSSYVRRGAAIGLGVLADPRAIPDLVRSVEDPSRDVALAAAQGLERLTGETFGANKPLPRGIGVAFSDLEPMRTAVRAWAAARSK